MGIRRDWTGGPGAGKTHRLQEEIQWMLEDGVPGSRIYATSYSVAAAQVLRARAGDELPPENIGTLHSAGYRQLSEESNGVLGGKKFSSKKDATDEWNEQFPQWRISREGRNEFGGAEPDGDKFLSLAARVRHRLRPEPEWVDWLQWMGKREQSAFFEFWDTWKRFKNVEGVVDFEDMIERPWREQWGPPNGVTHLVCDEWQDLTPLERQLVFGWLVRDEIDLLLTGGDPYQSINGYRGTDPLFEMPPSEIEQRYLTHSMRMPSAVVDWSEAWIERWAERPYRPRMTPVRDGGSVRVQDAWSLTNSEPVLDEVSARERDGQSVVLLASTNYMIDSLVPQMRARGIAFANPHRPKAGRWNPLGMPQATTMVERVMAWHQFFVEGYRTAGNLKRMAGLFRTKRIVKNQLAMSRALDQMPNDKPLDDEFMAEHWLDEGAVATMPQLMALGSAERAVAAMEYVEAMLRRGGPDYVRQKPLVHLGTVHSYKGHEADAVIVFPDVSAAAAQGYEMGGDELVRVAYVAGTRAKADLILCGSTRKHRMRW